MKYVVIGEPFVVGDSVPDRRTPPRPSSDPDVHERVIAEAARDGVSVSAWMTSAARRELLVRGGLTAVAEWEAEHGAIPEPAMESARRRVRDARARTREADAG